MINDVTYLMDESLSELAQIHNLQMEMRDMEGWMAQSAQTRREGDHRSLRQPGTKCRPPGGAASAYDVAGFNR